MYANPNEFRKFFNKKEVPVTANLKFHRKDIFSNNNRTPSEIIVEAEPVEVQPVEPIEVQPVEKSLALAESNNAEAEI